MIARALVHEPRLLILDEPTAGVDIELRRSMWDFLEEINAAGTTIILTTHYLEEAEELCDTIAIIDQGELRACDSTQNLLAQIDNKTLLVRSTSPLSTAPSLDGLDVKLIDDGRLAVTYNPGLIPVGLVISRLNEHGVDIADLDTRGAELENVFLKLTS